MGELPYKLRKLAPKSVSFKEIQKQADKQDNIHRQYEKQTECQ